MFAPIYKCFRHGETWHAVYSEDIDTVNDEIYPVHLCPQCYSECVPVLHEGHQVVHALTDEEMMFETMDWET